MLKRTTGISPASIATAEALSAQARDRIVEAVLGGTKYAEAFVAELQRCRAAWKHLDTDTYELAIEWAGNESEIRHTLQERSAQRKSWRFWP